VYDIRTSTLAPITFQINSAVNGSFSFNDLAFQTGYVNMARRWNWAVIGGQIPYVSGVIQSGVATSPTGEALAVERQIVYRQTERALSGVIAYPLDRARRIELTVWQDTPAPPSPLMAPTV
jgi:hypothetical protein